MAVLSVTTAVERWPLREAFVIARGAKTEASVVTVALSDGCFTGRGECVPYARYGETIDGVVAAIEAAAAGGGIGSRADLAQALPAGAARNALDCALWDLEAKRAGQSVAELTGVGPLEAIATCYTLSLGAPEAMARAAQSVPELKLLKLKLGGVGDDARMCAVRAARPDARLVADANEAWTPELLRPLLSAAAECGIELIEQPLAVADEAHLAQAARVVPICADESAHTSDDIARLKGLYDAVNIKLDKAGGLTEALAMVTVARAAGLRVMIGSMVSTSLAIAPAVLLAQGADWVDLDGPLLLARDRVPGVAIERGLIAPPPAGLWG